MPDSLTSCSGCIDSPQHASTMAAVTESWPQPAHRVDMLPSYCRRVSPNELVGSEGWATLGLLMYDMGTLSFSAEPRPAAALPRAWPGSHRRWAELKSADRYSSRWKTVWIS